jgi:hypothetical protein
MSPSGGAKAPVRADNLFLKVRLATAWPRQGKNERKWNRAAPGSLLTQASDFSHGPPTFQVRHGDRCNR